MMKSKVSWKLFFAVIRGRARDTSRSIKELRLWLGQHSVHQVQDDAAPIDDDRTEVCHDWENFNVKPKLTESNV